VPRGRVGGVLVVLRLHVQVLRMLRVHGLIHRTVARLLGAPGRRCAVAGCRTRRCRAPRASSSARSWPSVCHPYAGQPWGTVCRAMKSLSTAFTCLEESSKFVLDLRGLTVLIIHR
jgi:hypothetical protein